MFCSDKCFVGSRCVSEFICVCARALIDAWTNNDDDLHMLLVNDFVWEIAFWRRKKLFLNFYSEEIENVAFHFPNKQDEKSQEVGEGGKETEHTPTHTQSHLIV